MASSASDSLTSMDKIGHTTILRGIVGSTAYGLATPESDIDRIGVFQIPTIEFLGRSGNAEVLLDLDEGFEINVEAIKLRWNMEGKKDSKVTLKPDIQLHELGKYVNLAATGNPTASELVWLPEFEIMTEAGAMLVENRQLFLSQLTRARYIGYAWSQVERLRARGDFNSDLKKRTRKHGRHCARLLIQARQILSEGVLNVRLSESDATWCFEMGEAAEKDSELFADRMAKMIEDLNAVDSKLPDRPDGGKVQALLSDLRFRELASGAS